MFLPAETIIRFKPKERKTAFQKTRETRYSGTGPVRGTAAAAYFDGPMLVTTKLPWPSLTTVNAWYLFGFVKTLK